MEETLNQPQQSTEVKEIAQSKKEYVHWVAITILLLTVLILIYVTISQQKQINSLKNQNSEVDQTKTEIISPSITMIPTDNIVSPTEASSSALNDELKKFINPKNDPNVIFNIVKRVDNYADIAIGSPEGPGYRSIWKKDGEMWKQLLGTQDMWECETVFNENIPPSLVDGSCYAYKTQVEWKYNRDSDKWEKE